MMEGVIAVNKPAGWTSHDVVAKMRKWSRIRRIGHTGTLDPLATGVLPLCLGRATRLAEYLQDRPKEYIAQVRFGIATDTQDVTGQVQEEWEQVRLDPQEVERVVLSFVGQMEQVPPMFSAVKIGGKKLYELAREGIEIERKPRPITIYELEIIEINTDLPHPYAKFRVLCSKGTYIRTLCFDIGRKLGVPAAMENLVRTRSGDITLEMCHAIEDIDKKARSGQLQDLIIPADRLLTHMPEIKVDEVSEKLASHGQAIRVDPSLFSSAPLTSPEVRVYSRNNKFLGIFKWIPERQMLSPVKVFRD
jgi:tRNA pseudouridine55 synthase